MALLCLIFLVGVIDHFGNGKADALLSHKFGNYAFSQMIYRFMSKF